MEEEPKHGTVWSDDELDAIVFDYFAMLRAELRGEPYIKSKHSSALMTRIGRTHRSVEFKHQNISAVLSELGLPRISGYKPKENFQNSIFDAIDRYLSRNPSLFETIPTAPGRTPDLSNIFVSPPSMENSSKVTPKGLRRLIRKFDPAVRDLRNRSLGKAGEAFVCEIERRKLEEANRRDLAKKVRWVAAEDGDGAGYDVLSFAPTGIEWLIEVKTTNGSARTPFFMTRNESEMANERPNHWVIYRVHLFSSAPQIFTILPPLEKYVRLQPEAWRASFYALL
jgi:hypothetical protein